MALRPMMKSDVATILRKGLYSTVQHLHLALPKNPLQSCDVRDDSYHLAEVVLGFSESTSIQQLPSHPVIWVCIEVLHIHDEKGRVLPTELGFRQRQVVACSSTPCHPRVLPLLCDVDSFKPQNAIWNGPESLHGAAQPASQRIIVHDYQWRLSNDNSLRL